MSLLTSIFGGTADETSESKGGLFDTKVQVALVKRPPRKARKAAIESKETVAPLKEGDDDKGSLEAITSRKNPSHENSTEEEGSPRKKRKRKDPKPPAEPVEEEAEKNDVSQADDNGETAEPSARTVFVGNLPLATTRKSLAAIFKSCGTVQSARIRSVPVVGVKVPANRAGDQNLVKKVCANTNKIATDSKSSVHGYVVFSSTKSIDKALALNNTILPGDAGEGRRLRVDHADPSFDSTRSVFVGNLPYAADEDSLQQHVYKTCGFDDITNIQGVRIIRDKTTFQCKGFGYVLFQDRTMVATGLQRLDGSRYKERQLRVTVCGKRFKGRKGEAKPEKAPARSRAMQQGQPVKSVEALRRVLKKEESTAATKKHRPRAEKKKGPAVNKSGVSRRTASKVKVAKRVKKLEKRVSKGMGKTRK